jgi:hypothetical protein
MVSIILGFEFLCREVMHARNHSQSAENTHVSNVSRFVKTRKSRDFAKSKP